MTRPAHKLNAEAEKEPVGDTGEKNTDSQWVGGSPEDRSAGAGGLPMTFSFGKRAIRTVLMGGATWFVAADVCAVLGHTNTAVAIGRLDEDEKGVTTVYTLGGDQAVNVISESGLYALVLTSRKPQAKAFRRWITGEVLPEIRRTGSYNWAGRRPESERGIGFTINLPDPGRYITTIHPDGVVSTMAIAAISEDPRVSENDTRLLCYRIKTIECHWQQLQDAVWFREGEGALQRLKQLIAALREAGQVADTHLDQLHRIDHRSGVN